MVCLPICIFIHDFQEPAARTLHWKILKNGGGLKGLELIGTGDFTHPLWLKEIKERLTEKDGILYSPSGFKFLLTGEISLMYTQGKRKKSSFGNSCS